MLVALCAATAGAQAINHDETRLLSAPNGRPGCYAPLQVVFDAPDGAKSALVESISDGVVLTRQVNIDKPGRITTRLPWLVAKGSKVRVTIDGKSDEFTPPMPTRPQPPSYGRIYAAVFAQDTTKARELLKPGDDLTCDFFADRDAFEDWRLLDGYDAVLSFDERGTTVSKGFYSASGELSSLGCVTLSTRGIETHTGPEQFEGNPVSEDFKPWSYGDCWGTRYLGGAGAHYSFNSTKLFTRAVMIAAIRDHRWRGDDMPPSGPAPSRAVSEPYERGWLFPQGQEPPSAPAWFFALAGLVLLLTLLGPIVGARLTSRAWVAPLAIAVGATALCWLGSLQSGPPATVEVFTVESRGGEIASSRSYVTCEDIPGAPEIMTINLDAEGPRRLARSAPARMGCRAWVVDTPRTQPLEAGKAVELREGKIEDLIFRDYAAKARRGQSHFDEGQARILDWWLEANAYRGRDARLAPATPRDEPLADWPNVYWRQRGAITVTPLRK